MNSLKKVNCFLADETSDFKQLSKLTEKKNCENRIQIGKNEVPSDNKNKCKTDDILCNEKSDKSIEVFKINTSLLKTENKKDKIKKIDNKSNKLNANKRNSAESLEEFSQKTKVSSIDLNSNEIIISENEINYDSKKNSNDKYLKIFEEINEFIEFPKAYQLDIKFEKSDAKINDDQFFFYLKVFSEINKLNRKIDEINYLFDNYFSDISSIIIRMKNNSNFKIMEITNMRLEILINLLKNPNIVNIKRKLIEVIIFHLYSKNSEYFELDNNYIPPFPHLIELENLIIDKKIKTKKNKDILDDLKKLEKIKLSIKNNTKIPNVNQPKNNDKKKINHLNAIKDFLEFYKMKLHPYVHINDDNGKFYILPKCMFKTESNAREYLYTLESLIGNEQLKEKKNKDNLIGLGNKNETNIMHIYYEKKLLSIDEAINILFSFDSNISNLETDVIKQIKEKHEEFMNDLNMINTKYKNLFGFTKSSKFDEYVDFSKNIEKQIKNYVETFEKNVISKLYDILNLLFLENNLKDCKNIIEKLNSFLKGLIQNSNFQINEKIYKEFKDKNQVLFFIIIKICIMQKMIDLMRDYKKRIQDYLENEEKSFLNLLKKIRLNLKHINNYVTDNCKLDNISDIYNKWCKYSLCKNITINELKNYIRENINEKINLEMNYVYDNKFCLWAIKNGFEKYFH